MPIGERLNSLLRSYAEANHPRVKISYLRLAIALVETMAPEFKEELSKIEKRLRTISSQANWDAYGSYALAGRWEALNDQEYFVFADLLSELDDVATTLMGLIERKKARIKEGLRRGPLWT